MTQSRRKRFLMQSTMLFAIALGSWMAYQYLYRGSFVAIPGILTAGLLAAAGSSALRHLETARGAQSHGMRIERNVHLHIWRGGRRIVRESVPAPHRYWHRPAA